MGRVLLRRAAGALATCSALALGACAAAGTGSSTSPVFGHPGAGGTPSAPARDTFTGAIVSGQGAYSGARGVVTIYLHPRGVGRARAIQVVLRSHCAGSSSGCTALDGSIDGSLTRAVGRIPDVGSRYVLAARGPVRPLGEVMARGVVQAPAVIAGGPEVMAP